MYAKGKAYDMTTREIADLLGVTGYTVHNWEARGQLPPCYRVGRRTRRWNRAEVMAWLQARRTRQEEWEAKWG